MAKHLVEVTDAAGIKRMVKAVDAREIEASVSGKPVEVPVVEVVDEEASEVDLGGFPANFPGAEAFAAEGIGYHQALRMTKEELTAVKGIGEATADKVLKHRGA